VFEDNDEITCEIIEGNTANKRRQKEKKIYEKEKEPSEKEQHSKIEEEKFTERKLIYK
jgi:hypothetical protein